jgi:hypothetical protein
MSAKSPEGQFEGTTITEKVYRQTRKIGAWLLSIF